MAAMTDALDIQKILCHHCHTVLDVGDNFCRHCGAPLSELAARGAAGRGGCNRAVRPPGLLENRWAVLASLFLLLGPLGLPMLWRSRQFSNASKIILTVIVAGITAAIVVLLWYVFGKLLDPLRRIGELKHF